MATDEDFKKLEIAHKLREFHHQAIWEEEKHFTWWVSIIFGAQILIFTNNGINSWLKFITITVASSVGFIICYIADKILRKEGIYFHQARSSFVTYHNKVIEPKIGSVPDKPNLDVYELFDAEKEKGGRDYFLILFFLLRYSFIPLPIISFVYCFIN